MKNLVIASGLIAVMFSAAANADEYVIDPTHTYANFAISHLGYSTMHGRFDSTKGELMLDTKAKKASVEITIDAASVSTGFQKRDDHLRSPDFLNVAENPTITFKSTKATFNGDKVATVEGELTMVGVTKPVTLTVTHMHCAPHPMPQMKGKMVCGFDAEATIKRSDFGVKYGVPGIGDEMHLTLEVEAGKK